jgi:hypothetical protein
MEVNVDQIVRDVLARIEANENRSSQPATAKPQPAPTAELRWPSRVVTAAELADKLHGINHLIVAAGAVITPSAADLLRERGVALTYENTKDKNKGHTASIVMAIAETTFNASAFAGGLQSRGIRIERLAQAGLTAAVDEASELVARDGRRAVLVTGRAAAAACRANRQAAVRAVAGSRSEDLSRAAEETEANMLIVEPGAMSLHGLVNLVATFASRPYGAGPAMLASKR